MFYCGPPALSADLTKKCRKYGFAYKKELFWFSLYSVVFYLHERTTIFISLLLRLRRLLFNCYYRKEINCSITASEYDRRAWAHSLILISSDADSHAFNRTDLSVKCLKRGIDEWQTTNGKGETERRRKPEERECSCLIVAVAPNSFLFFLFFFFFYFSQLLFLFVKTDSY